MEVAQIEEEEGREVKEVGRNAVGKEGREERDWKGRGREGRGRALEAS